jgi:hypothetical protein
MDLEDCCVFVTDELYADEMWKLYKMDMKRFGKKRR